MESVFFEEANIIDQLRHYTDGKRPSGKPDQNDLVVWVPIQADECVRLPDCTAYPFIPSAVRIELVGCSAWPTELNCKRCVHTSSVNIVYGVGQKGCAGPNTAKVEHNLCDMPFRSVALNHLAFVINATGNPSDVGDRLLSVDSVVRGPVTAHNETFRSPFQPFGICTFDSSDVAFYSVLGVLRESRFQSDD